MPLLKENTGSHLFKRLSETFSGSLNSVLESSYWLGSDLDSKYRSFIDGIRIDGIRSGRSSIIEPTLIEQVVAPPTPPDNAGDSLTSANNIGNLTHNLTTSYSDWIGSSDINDFYQFNLLGQSDFRLSLNGLIADANLELFNSSGQIISSSILGGTTSEVIDLTGLAAGNYFARVYSTTGTTNYSLSLLTDYTRIDGTVQNRGPLLFDRTETRPVNIRIPEGALDSTIDNTETWIVIHGHRSAPDGSIGQLARTIGQTRQVLVLDWSEPADNAFVRPDLSARWIHEVSEFAVNSLRNIWGLATSNINLIGHSLGSYVASEIGAIFTGPDRQNPQINDLIALDPARSSTVAGYDINGLERGFQAISNFREVSTFSRAFWGEGLPIPERGGEGLGSERYAHSADESFRIEFDASDDAIANHSNIITLFTNMLNDTTSPISRLFQLDQTQPGYWEISDRDEGVIRVNEQNRPRALYFLTPPSNWVDAQNRAALAGGNLVTINDSDEKNWLQSTFNIDQDVWIGLTDSSIYGTIEGNFLWISGQPITYTNWADGEPNNFPHTSEGEDFAALNLDSGTWNDLPLEAAIRGVVEVV